MHLGRATKLLIFQHLSVMLTVSLADVHLRAPVGITAAERQVGAELLLNLTVEVEVPLPVTTVDHTLDYSRLAAAVTEAAAAEAPLIETVAERIVDAVQALDSRIKCIEVHVSKLYPVGLPGVGRATVTHRWCR